jgi:excisionase family DNA binding protein
VLLTFPEAAEAVGCTRQHLYRLVQKGKLSASSGPDGTRRLETSELLRVFGKLNTPSTATATGDSNRGDTRLPQATAAPVRHADVLEVELRAAREALRVAEDRLREAAEREARLLELLSSQSRLLEHRVRDEPAPIPAPPPPARSSEAAPSVFGDITPVRRGPAEGLGLEFPTLADFFKKSAKR